MSQYLDRILAKMLHFIVYFHTSVTLPISRLAKSSTWNKFYVFLRSQNCWLICQQINHSVPHFSDCGKMSLPKRSVPSWPNPPFYFLTFGHSGAQSWALECQKSKRVVRPVWPYTLKGNHLTPLGLKGLNEGNEKYYWLPNSQNLHSVLACSALHV